MTGFWLTICLLGAAVWIGGLATILVVVTAAGRSLDEQSRVGFFRALGRAYLPVGIAALVAAYVGGAALLLGQPWTGLATLAVLLALALVGSLALGVRQARRIGTLREQALADPGSGDLLERTRTGARRAMALRSTIAVLSLALFLTGIAIAS